MSQRSDWLPTDRSGQLAMAKNWVTLITANQARWKITPDYPPAVLGALAAAAETALEEAKNETTRTPVATAKCKAAFATLIEAMRNIKKRFFYVPPLTDADLIALGLKPKDTTQTPSGTPTAQTTIETYLVGRHELGIKIIYLTGSYTEAANKGYRIWYSVIAQGAASTDAPAPTNPDDLKKSFYTKRLKDIIEFDYNDSGKIAWMAVQIENEGKKGPWGPLVSALIP